MTEFLEEETQSTEELVPTLVQEEVEKEIPDELFSLLPPDDPLRPDITHLEMAVDDKGNFIPQVGDKVVIERCCSLLPSRCWLDTCLYIVKDIDYDNGDLKLWNEDEKQHALCNYIDGTLAGYSFRLPPEKGHFSTKKEIIYYDKGEEPEPTLISRMRSEGLIFGEPSIAEGLQVKQRAKKRPKHIIEAEKRAWQEAREAKRAARMAKKNALK